MKIKEINDESTEEVVIGDIESIEASISKENMGFLFDIVSNQIYKNPIGSICREITSNCFDSHIEAKVNEPVIVKKGYDENGTYISFIDKGVGLSPDRMKDIYINYFSSSKRDTDEQIGMFGLGSKSPLSYSEIFYIITIYNGIEYTYSMSKGSKIPVLDKLSERKTTQGNGTEIKINIKNYTDERNFQEELRKQLAYFDNVYFDTWNIENNYQILETDHFKFRKESPYNDMHIVIGKVSYPIDWKELKIDVPYYIPVAIKFNIGELQITPSRESIRYTEENKKIIKDRIEVCLNYIKKLYNENSQEIDDIYQYIDRIKELKSNNYVLLKLKDFKIILHDYKDIPILKNINFPVWTPLKEFKDIYYNIPYDPFIFWTSNKKLFNSKLKNVRNKGIRNLFESRSRSIYLDKDCNDRVKNKYIENCDFIIKKSESLSFGYICNLLNVGILGVFSKGNCQLGRAKFIYEYKKIIEKELLSRVVTKYSEVIVPEEFKNKSIAFDNNKRRKTEGKILIYDIKKQYRKEVNLSEFDNPKGIIIYGFKKDKELLHKYNELFSLKRSLNNFACFYISRTSEKLIKNNKLAIHINQFMGDNRIFRKLATGIRVKNNIPRNFNIKYIEKLSKDLGEKIFLLDKYTEENYNYNIDYYKDYLSELEQNILDIAEKNNLWDEEIIHIVKEVELFYKDCNIIKYIALEENNIYSIAEYLKKVGKRLNYIWYSNSNKIQEYIKYKQPEQLKLF